MKISILTLFPEMFVGPFSESIVKIAQDKKLVEINFVNIRNYGIGKHQIVDDTPYGGGYGMVMRVDVLYEALQYTIDKNLKKNKQQSYLLSAHGKPFTQDVAKSLSTLDHLLLICGHYEGVDNRILKFIDGEISIGDFVTTGGEIPSMLVVDTITRLIPGVLKEGVTDNESFSLAYENKKVLEFPQYTRPDTFMNISVPEVLKSGNHQKITKWRAEQTKIVTKEKRPDLLNNQ